MKSDNTNTLIADIYHNLLTSVIDLFMIAVKRGKGSVKISKYNINKIHNIANKNIDCQC